MDLDLLKTATRPEFAGWAGVIMGDITHVHPFREGNGRTQLQFFKLLCEYLAFQVDLRKLDGPSWIAASRAANRGDYRLMTAEIEKALV
jgi:cell filamentation protein